MLSLQLREEVYVKVKAFLFKRTIYKIIEAQIWCGNIPKSTKKFFEPSFLNQEMYFKETRFGVGREFEKISIKIRTSDSQLP